MGWAKNFAKPEGRVGRLIIADMNIGHTAISKWGLAHYDWQPGTAAGFEYTAQTKAKCA